MRRRLSAALYGAACAALAVLSILASRAEAATVSWHRVGGSVYGGSCEAGHIGYRGADLDVLWHSVAELGMGTAMGGLPNKARLRLLLPATHRRLTVYKRDIGRGGGRVFDPVRRVSLLRAVDLYEPLLTALLGHRNCNWTGVVLWRRI